VISQELARELKVAQLPWRPRRGDLVMDRLNVPYLVLRDDTDDAGGVEVDTGGGVERKPFLGLTWVPRVDQLLDVLARHGAFDLSVRAAAEGRRDREWALTLTPAGEETARTFTSTNAGQAAGLALHYVLSVRGWRPGGAA
jgi:hypothetical protein